MPAIDAPKLTHAFDLTVIGPPGFASESSKHSARSVAHGQISFRTCLLGLSSNRFRMIRSLSGSSNIRRWLHSAGSECRK